MVKAKLTLVIPATTMFDHRVLLFDAFILVCISIRLSVLGAAVVDYKCDTGLATFDDVTKGLANTSVLRDGELGWISGYADLSTFLTFEGCSNLSMINAERIKNVSGPKGNILNICVHYCSDMEYDYIGVEGDTCYCFERQDRENLIDKMDIQSSLSCLSSCETIFSSSCDRFLLVYKFVKQNIQIHDYGQCINAARRNERLHFYTTSCYTHKLVHNNICQNIDKCDNEKREYPHFFRVNSYYSTMLGALTQCLKHGGFLLSLDNKNKMEYLFRVNHRYHWVNAFRVINPVGQKQNSCLAITRRNSTFLLDSDDCRNSRVPICKLDNMEQHMITPQDQVTSTQIPVLVGTSVGSVLVIASVIVIIVIYRRRRQDRSENHLLQDTHSVDTQQHITASPNAHHRSHTTDVQYGNTKQNKSGVSDLQNHVYDQIDETAIDTNTAYITPCISTEQVIMASSDSHCNQTLNQRNSKQNGDHALKDKMAEQHRHYGEDNKANTNVEAKSTREYPYIDLLDDKESVNTYLDNKYHEAYGQDYSNTVGVDDMDYLNVTGDVTSDPTLPNNADTKTGYTDLRGQESFEEQKYTELDIAENDATTINTDATELEYDYADMEGK